MKVKLTTNLFTRVIITHPDNNLLAWTGTQWAQIDTSGLATGTEICNFQNKKEAGDYCQKRNMGIE